MNDYNYRDPLVEARKTWEEAQVGFPIRARNISEETVRDMEIRLVVHGNKVVKHLYPLYDIHDNIVAFKQRDVDTKQFSVRYMQDPVPVQLHGMRLKKPGGKKVVIVEGELDVAAARDMFKQSKYHKNVAVVSIISGVDSAKKSFKLKENYEYIESFDEIILALDFDDEGQKAVEDLATVFDPKKIFVLPNSGLYKDANQALMEGHQEDFLNGVAFPQKYRPKGVLSALELMERALNPRIVESYDYPFDELNKKTWGARKGEFVAWLAQTGIGKTSVFENIQHYWMKKYPEMKIANISLEKPSEETVRAIVGLEVGKALNHPEMLPKIVDMGLESVYKSLFGETESQQRFFTYDGWGSIDIDELVSTIRYYANVLECDFIFFDHVSLAVSDQRNESERKALDEITTKLAELVIETEAGLHVISHMNDAGQARGSRNIDKVCWIRIDLTRHKDHEDDDIRNTTFFSVDKNRTTGQTGPAGAARWNAITTRMDNCVPPEVYEEKPNTGNVGAKLTLLENQIKQLQEELAVKYAGQSLEDFEEGL